MRPAPWDERSLGVSVIELVEIAGHEPAALDAVLAGVDRLCAAEGVGLATTRIAASAEPAVAALRRADYRHVETSHALRLSPVTVAPGLRRGLTIERAQPADATALAELVRTFEHSRYLEDDRIHPARGRERAAGWIVDSLTNGDEVMVTRRNGMIAAVMSWHRTRDEVRLLLGGTALAAGPIAAMFWAAILEHLAAAGVVAIETRVSAANPAALRLHRALGFVAGGPDLGMTKLYSGGAAVVGAPPESPRTT
jgi:hypothetical protein